MSRDRITSRRWALLVSAGLLSCLSAAQGQSGLQWIAETPRLTGDWGGARSALEEHGVRFNIFYNHYRGQKDSGGAVPSASSSHSGSVDWFGQVDLAQAGFRGGGTVLFHIRNTWSENLNFRVGALGDPIDDADDDHPLYLHQIWYQHGWLEGRVVARAGYIDQQSIVDRNAFANAEDRQFMNAYLDNNPVVPVLAGAGAAVFLEPFEGLTLVAATSDAESRSFEFNWDTAFNGDWNYLVHLEADIRAWLPVSGRQMEGNYRFGMALDPRDRMVFGSRRIDAAQNRYFFSGDQMLFAEPEENPDRGRIRSGAQGLGVFGRYGWQPGQVNRVEHFWSAGLEYRGPIDGRDRDVAAFGFYEAVGSAAYRENVEAGFDRERGYEAYYALEATPAIVFTPAVQYIHQPGALRDARGVWIFALRLRLSL